eukprot:TRINITY_DN35899_c0_g1_i2.p1 TRINITY_DN35899_c0_g1~~TRINITY_DN35899_c0_g1_i2.p1  ORF type:complete len:493 (-),score=83.30 TRINITY_DN35899_c0_g1_i2:292-1770(-)
MSVGLNFSHKCSFKHAYFKQHKHRPSFQTYARPRKSAKKDPGADQQDKEYQKLKKEYFDREEKNKREEREQSEEWRQSWKEFFSSRQLPKNEKELRQALNEQDPQGHGTIGGNFTPDCLYQYPTHDEKELQASFVFSVAIDAPREVIYPYISQWQNLPSVFDIIGAIYHDDKTPDQAIIVAYYEYPEHPMVQTMFPIVIKDKIENKIIRAESQAGFIPLDVEIRLEEIDPFTTEMVVNVAHAAPYPFYSSPGMTFFSLHLREVLHESVQLFKQKIEGTISSQGIDEYYRKLRPDYTLEELEIVKRIPWKQFNKFNEAHWQGIREAFEMQERQKNGEEVPIDEIKKSLANTFGKYIEQQKYLPDDDEGFVEEIHDQIKQQVNKYFKENRQKIRDMIPFMNEDAIKSFKYKGSDMDKSFDNLYKDVIQYIKDNEMDITVEDLKEEDAMNEFLMDKVLPRQQQPSEEQMDVMKEILEKVRDESMGGTVRPSQRVK